MSELKKCYEMETLSPKFPYMPKDEWQGRINKAKSLMKDKGIDALLLFNRKNQVYYFGWVKPYPYVYPAAGIVLRDGPATFFTEVLGINNLELKGYAEKAVGFRGDPRAPTPNAPVPVDALAELLKDIGLGKGTIAVDKGEFSWWDTFTLAEWEKLTAALPEVKWTDAMDTLISPQRMIKSPWEQDVIRKLMYATAKGYMKGAEVALPGVNEKDVFYAMMDVWMREERIIDSIYDMRVLQTSRNVATAFYEDHILEEGDYIFLDGGPSYKEYMSDMQRQIWIGHPDKLEKMYPGFRKWVAAAEVAHIEIEDALKPGTTMGELWQKGHEVLVRYLGDWYWDVIRSNRYIGWVGHCQGLYLHEPPYIVENETAKLKPGMVMCLELPALNLEKRVWINMPENVYLITDDGFEPLTDMLGPNGVYTKY
jgi:Xaa-Pro aminopeptidase